MWGPIFVFGVWVGILVEKGANVPPVGLVILGFACLVGAGIVIGLRAKG